MVSFKKKQKAKTEQSQPNTAETISPEFLQTESTTEQVVEEPKAEEPKVAKVKKTRYANVAAIPDTAVITWFKPEAKGQTGKSKSSTRYNRYYKTGITVAEFCQAYKDNNEPRMLARNDLRWDLQHGLIQLETPAVAEKETVAAE
jgi:hypothetical protein